MEVRGGAGSTAADVPSMVAVAGSFADRAADALDLTNRLAAAAVDVEGLGSAAVDPAGWASARGALVRAAVDGGALAARLGVLGAAVRTAAYAYEREDAAVARAVGEARAAVAGSAGQLIWRTLLRYGVVAVGSAGTVMGLYLLARTADLVVALPADAVDDVRHGRFQVDSIDDRLRAFALAAGDRVAGDVRTAGAESLGWLARHPDIAEHVVGGTPSFLSGATGLRAGGTTGPVPQMEAGRWSFPPEDVDDLALLAALVGISTGVVTSTTVRVRPAQAPPPQPRRAAADVGDLVRGAVALAPTRHGTLVGEPGRIRVERVVSGGRSRAVVYVPATQSWELGEGTVPMDGATNLLAMAQVTTQAEVAVTEALRQAEIGADEPLLLVGYSQGGLTSLGLVNNPAFRQEFSPEAVLTVGSPVGGHDVPDGVEVLSIEHAEDLVTALDGRPNPAAPTWTTVRRELLEPTAGDALAEAVLDGDPLVAHTAGPYIATADLVDASDHESVLAWKRRVAPFLDAPGTTVSATDWVAERVR